MSIFPTTDALWAWRKGIRKKSDKREATQRVYPKFGFGRRASCWLREGGHHDGFGKEGIMMALGRRAS
eukprot:1149842-Pelagomonas_calceolata.AAC.3